MESPPRDRLTTRAVGLTLLLGLVALLVGMILAAGEPRLPEGGMKPLPLGELPAGLAAKRAAAWLSLGVLFLLLTPLARLLGMLRDFLRDGDRLAASGAATLVVVLLASIGLGLT